ncbi:class I SAM-dependent methyltransferase [Phytoactinopolyspora halotolerans]|uniref:Class I SAM-dependent methyltransferase n=1 Tax=Phytoactinopolyspora halotolerans TaxID=1981512 RepID=A0A6L9SDD3_9ACTN|nr:class I SAM-dependent methyltransferase [Phytoactinopolyspora halotolerans]NEE03117.1 class I SAM-dependent methyltransferase [Phytoactinopolyspora halotolerans]
MDSVVTPTVSADVAHAWMRRWDVQQEHYIADREERFAVIADVVQAAVRDVDEPVIVDLGCGPGSLSARLRERLPAARIIGIDADPLLLGLGRAHYGDAIEWVDADLAEGSWRSSVPATIHAAVSTTALHWLPTESLAELYRDLASLTVPGGVYANGDHLGLDDKRLQSLATVVRDRRAERVGVLDNEDWHAWWDAIGADPAMAGLVRQRAERLAARNGAPASGDRATTSADDPTASTDEDAKDSQTHDGNGLTVADHIAMLTAAGYATAAPIWQVGDDHVLVALR